MRRCILIGLALALVAPANAVGAGRIHEHSSARDSVERRGAPLAPSTAQRAAAARLDARTTWNRFGTPRSLFKPAGWLADGLASDARVAAREFVRRNAALYRLSAADVSALAVVADHRLGSDAHVVTFEQRFGDLPTAGSGLVSVGVVGGKVAYASSSLGGSGALQGERRLTAQDAWLTAARNAGVEADAGDIGVAPSRAGFGQLRVAGLTELQQVREVAVPTPRNGVRRAFEANVVDNGREPLA